MTRNKGDQAFILQEGSEWLRYAFWSCAIGMGLLAANAINAPVRDIGKIVGSMLGVLLLGFSGFVLRIRSIVVDPSSRVVTITSKGFRRTSTERLRFDEIRKILVLATFDTIENLRGANIARERWGFALLLEEHSVAVTKILYITKEQAMRDAVKMQHLIGVEITDTREESITHLVKSGRKIEAVTLASREVDMTSTQAKDHIARKTGQSAQPSRARSTIGDTRV